MSTTRKRTINALTIELDIMRARAEKAEAHAAREWRLRVAQGDEATALRARAEKAEAALRAALGTPDAEVAL